jgi:glycosyltransferase involved in cell wall biosynthesis
MKLTYFGNKLSKHGRSKSVLETLEPLLREFCEVRTYSSKSNQYLRLLDMLYHFFAKGLRSDTVMIDVYSTKNFYFAYILGWLSSIFNKPYILFLHGGNLPLRYNNSKKKVDQIFKRAKAIVAPSDYLKSFFEKKGFPVVLIPNVIDIKKFPFRQRDFTSPQLFYIRGFGKIYNPLMTVRVVMEFIDEYPCIKLAMLGSDIDESLHETKKLLTELKLEGHVKILGKKSQAEWIELSKDFNIMVSNPIIDNTPVSIIEGMALGLLVVSTNVGGVSHLVNDRKDGMLIKSGDFKAMANAIREVLSDASLSLSLQQNARKKAESFSWENIRPMWENLLLHKN